MDNKECAKKIFKELCGAGFLFKFYFTLRELTGYTHFTEFLWECPDDKIIGAMDNMQDRKSVV